MLSKTAERKPRPKAVGHEAGGQLLDRHHRGGEDEGRAGRWPLERLGEERPVGLAQRRRHEHREDQTATPMNGKESASSGCWRFTKTLTEIAAARITTTTSDATPVDVGAARRVLEDRRVLVLLERGRNAEDDQRHDRRDVGVEHGERRHAVDPHHRRRRVADDAARAAGVRGGDDRREIADVDLALKTVCAIAPPIMRGGDVVEERRQHEDHHQQDERALPVVRQVIGQQLRDFALLEVVGEQREAHQQAEEVDDDDPLVVEVASEAGEAGAGA